MKILHQVLIDSRVYLKAYHQINFKCFICRSFHCFAFQINQDYMCAEKKAHRGYTCHLWSRGGFISDTSKSFKRRVVLRVIPSWCERGIASFSRALWELPGGTLPFWQVEYFNAKLFYSIEQSWNNKPSGNRGHCVLMEQSGQMCQTSLWPIYHTCTHTQSSISISLFTSSLPLIMCPTRAFDTEIDRNWENNPQIFPNLYDSAGEFYFTCTMF